MSILGVVLTDKNPGAKPSTLQPLGSMWLHRGHARGLPEDSGVALLLKKAAEAETQALGCSSQILYTAKQGCLPHSAPLPAAES